MQRQSGIIRLSVYLLFFVTIIIIWEIYSLSGQIKLFISSPSMIFSYFLNNHMILFKAVLATLYEASMGLLIAVTFSFTIMIICFLIPKVMEFILPLMIISQVIPLITLAPLLFFSLGLALNRKS